MSETRFDLTGIDNDAYKRLKGVGITSATIHYFVPYSTQRIINPHWLWWQYEDFAPNFPNLRRYVDWWQKEMAGKVHSVDVAHRHLIKPLEFRAAKDGVFRLH